MQETFDTELAAVRPRVLDLARRFVRASGLRTDADDIAQDVLLRLWTALNEGAQIRSLDAWAVAVTKNLCISLLRKSRSRAEAPLPESLPAAGSAASGIEAEEGRRRIALALEHIPAATRHLLQMRTAGMSLDEMAAVTGRPKASIKSAVSAARRQILNELNATI